MMRRYIALLAVAAAASLLLPDTSFAATSHKQKVQRTKITVYGKRHWRGYGFLPGYRPQLAESQGTPVLGPPLPRRERRYYDWYGNVRYGWGSPGFYRGRYNGGSFGPCWTYTPIGMMPNCGQ